MLHKRAESEDIKTPHRATITRPKSMFAHLSPENMSMSDADSSLEHPTIPKRSPNRRMKRISMLLRPSGQDAPPRTPTFNSQESFMHSPLRSPALHRQSSFQTRRYNFEDKEEDMPPSPRRSMYSQTTPSRSSLLLASAPPSTKPLFLEKKAGNANLRMQSPSIGGNSPQLLQSPQFDTQDSVWISEDRPKRSSLVGRSTSVRASSRMESQSRHKKSNSQGSGIKVSQIGHPHLMETTNKLAASVLAANNGNIPVRSYEGATLLASPMAPLNPKRDSTIGLPMSAPASAPTTASTTTHAGAPVGSPVAGSPIAGAPISGTQFGAALGTPISAPDRRNSKYMGSSATQRPSTPLAFSQMPPQSPGPAFQKYFTPETPPAPQPSSPISGSIGKLRRFFKLDKRDHKSTPKTPVPIPTPVGLPAPVPSTTPMVVPQTSGRTRKSQSATAVPTRPMRLPDVTLFRQESEASLDSSSGSSSSNSAGPSTNVLRTPINNGPYHSPRIYGDHDWDYSTPHSKHTSHRHSMIEDKRDRRLVTTPEWI